MTAPALRPPWLLATLTCTVVGLFTYLLTWPVTFDFQDLDTLPESYVIPRLTFLLIQLPAGLISLVCLQFVLRHTGKVHPTQYAAAALTVVFGTASMLGAFAGLLAIIELASRRSIRWAALAAAAGMSGAFLSLIADPDKSDFLTFFAVSCVVIIACLLIGVGRGKRREAAEAAWQHAQLSARHDERLRIARDMHDSLTHRLSLISVHAGVLELRPDLSEAKRTAQATTIREQATAAVADLQEVLSVLRTPPESVDPRLSAQELVAQARAAGMDVRLRMDWRGEQALTHLNTTSQHTVHRMLQECLTNARKHAPGEPVTITVAASDRLRIIATNPGGPEHSDTGLGLIGLRERAELCGGTLSVTTDPFTVALELPCPSA